jgi:hypothetical protein
MSVDYMGCELRKSSISLPEKSLHIPNNKCVLAKLHALKRQTSHVKIEKFTRENHKLHT